MSTRKIGISQKYEMNIIKDQQTLMTICSVTVFQNATELKSCKIPVSKELEN